MNQFTPAQQKAIQSWTEQRDSLLREVGNYSTELDVLKTCTKEQGLNLAALHNSIAETRGRLAELVALEERHKGSVSVEVAELDVRKARLQGEVTVLEEKCNDTAGAYAALVEATATLEKAHDVMKDQAVIVNRVVGEIIQTSQAHISDMKTIMVEIKTISTEVIDKGKENVKQTGIILEKLPKYIFELQRPIPVRRRVSNGEHISVNEEIKP